MHNCIEVYSIVWEELKQQDVWTFSLDEYEETALDKWSCFVEASVKEPDKIIILESSVFQFQIFTYLLKNAAYRRMEKFIDKLFQILAPLSPVLIYLYRERNEDSVDYLEKDRGVQYLEYIWNRDKGEPYYKDRPEGAEGHREFLLDYGKWADNLFKAASCRKLSIEITGKEWTKYEQEMLYFLDIENRLDSDEKFYTGLFRAETSDNELKIDGLTLTDPEGQVRKLTPKSENEFYIRYLPLVLKFDGSDKVIIEGGHMPESWAANGTVYVRQYIID